MGEFLENVVNQRFKKVYAELEKLNLIRGKSDIAKNIGTYNHIINSILKGERNITVNQLNKLFDVYGVNANYIFGISEEMFYTDNQYDDLMVRSKEEMRNGVRNNIVLIPDKALAGYAISHQDGDYLNALQRFSIPGLQGDLTAFEISGDSMMPTITNGDLVICEAVERNTPLRDNHVYVIVTDVVVTKRIQQVKVGNKLLSLRLISDNSNVYKPYEIKLEEIRQILQVKCRLTAHAIS